MSLTETRDITPYQPLVTLCHKLFIVSCIVIIVRMLLGKLPTSRLAPRLTPSSRPSHMTAPPLPSKRSRRDVATRPFVMALGFETGPTVVATQRRAATVHCSGSASCPVWMAGRENTFAWWGRCKLSNVHREYAEGVMPCATHATF
jgi:hypothetical protein